ncbi:hypothetical protein BGZ73_007290 [Actinomortierella ambigua]|nr:hypothetical protein BGZ73_007290 [Actinomortierella ambigua]
MFLGDASAISASDICVKGSSCLAQKYRTEIRFCMVTMDVQLCRRAIHLWTTRPTCPHNREPIRLLGRFRAWPSGSRSTLHRGHSTHSTPGSSSTNPTPSANTASTTTTTTASSAANSQAHSSTIKRSNVWDASSEATLLEMQTQGASWEQIGLALGKDQRLCQLHYETNLHPALKTFWTPTKVAQLQDMTAKGTSWTEIAKALDTSLANCVEKHQQLVVLAKRKAGSGGDAGNSIRSSGNAAPTLDIKAKTTKKSRITAEWDAESDKTLLAMRASGAKWSEIAQRIGREPATCLHRYESTLNPQLAHFWTDDKVRQLDQLVSSGKAWTDTARILGVHRLACKEKWRLMGQKELAIQKQSVLEWAEAKKELKQKQREQVEQSQRQRLEGSGLAAVKNLQQSLGAVDGIDQEKDQRVWNDLLRDEARYAHYRSWKKQALSDSFSNLYLMQAGWSAKEETILIQHVLKNGLHRWDQVSAALQGRFSPEECRSCWKNLDMPVAMPEGDLEEKMQDSGVVRFREEGKDTTAVTTTATAVMALKAPKTGNAIEGATLQWTSDQQVHFWYLWREYGENWSSISKALGDRSPDACKAYFQNITSIMHGGHEHADDDESGDGIGSIPSEEVERLARAITHNFTRKWRQPNSAVSKAGVSNEVVAAEKKTQRPFVWTKARSVRLQSLIRQAYRGRKNEAISAEDINWNWLARHVHPEVSGRVCRNHWRYLHSMQAQWTQEDIRRLEEGVRLLGPRKLTTIRQHFLPHMSKDDVTRQWFRISDKAATITEDEYYTLLAAVEKHGTEQWDLVESEMPSGWKRPPCKRVWESSFQHLIGKGGWIESEDKRLVKLVEMIGRDDWFAVAKAMQTQHSPWESRLRWCQLIDEVRLEDADITLGGEPVSQVLSRWL